MVFTGAAMLTLLGASQAPQSAGGLDNNSLRAILQGLGYELGTTSNQTYQISMKQGQANFTPEVWISSSGRKIWISQNIRQIGKGELDNPIELAALLAANSEVGPAQFYIENESTDPSKPNWHLCYAYPVDNRAVTADVIHDALTAFLSGLTKEAAVWAPPTPAPAPGGGSKL
jgi:hypothetical protein